MTKFAQTGGFAIARNYLLYYFEYWMLTDAKMGYSIVSLADFYLKRNRVSHPG